MLLLVRSLLFFFSIKRAARTQIQATKSLMIFRDSVFPLDSSVVCVWQCRCSLTLNSAAIEMFLTSTEFVRVCEFFALMHQQARIAISCIEVEERKTRGREKRNWEKQLKIMFLV